MAHEKDVGGSVPRRRRLWDVIPGARQRRHEAANTRESTQPYEPSEKIKALGTGDWGGVSSLYPRLHFYSDEEWRFHKGRWRPTGKRRKR
jgi:hypothetical protein